MGYDDLQVELPTRRHRRRRDRRPGRRASAIASPTSRTPRAAHRRRLRDRSTSRAPSTTSRSRGSARPTSCIAVGSDRLVPELDEQLRGNAARRHPQVRRTLPERFGDRAGEEVSFQVLVKDTKRKVLPEPTDEWVDEVSEFDTVDELRDDIRRRLGLVQKLQAQMLARDKVLEAVAELVPTPRSRTCSSTTRPSADLSTTLRTGWRIRKRRSKSTSQATGQEPEAFIDEVREGRRAGRARRPRAASGRQRKSRSRPATTRSTPKSTASPNGWSRSPKRYVAISNGEACWRRYALTSLAARRSSSSSITRRRRRVRQRDRPHDRRRVALPRSFRRDPRTHPRRRRRRTYERSVRRDSSRCAINTVPMPSIRFRHAAAVAWPATCTRGSLNDRIIFLGTPVDDIVANLLIAQLIHPRVRRSRQGHLLYINSPGGEITGAVRDLRHDAVHQARRADDLHRAGRIGGGGAARFGRTREALHRFPHARILIHQPHGGASGPGGRHRDPGQRDHPDARAARRDPRVTTPASRSRRVKQGHRPRLHHECRRGPDLRLVDEVLTNRELAAVRTADGTS